MHIRYKQSCLIILRHISDRVINKHCKINEEKCDLQFPLIGKALAFPRRKVIARGPRGGEGRDRASVPSAPQPLPRPALSCPARLDLCLLPPVLWGVESRVTGGGAGNTRSLMAQDSPLWFEAWWDSRVTVREPRAELPTLGCAPGHPVWAQACGLTLGPRPGPSLLSAACPSKPLSLCHI